MMALFLFSSALFSDDSCRPLLRVFSNGLRKLIWLFHCSACVIAMDSIKGQGGIQMLLTAEQEAQQMVSSARNSKISILFSKAQILFM